MNERCLKKREKVRVNYREINGRGYGKSPIATEESVSNVGT